MAETTGKAAVAIALFAGAAVIAGLVVSGGPIRARQEKRDNTRWNDLLDIRENILCQAQSDGRLPQSPQVTENCPRPLRLRDPFTDQPYDYTLTDDRHWRLCASFELPESMTRQYSGWQVDPASGCLIGMVDNLPPPQAPADSRAAPAPAKPEPEPEPEGATAP